MLESLLGGDALVRVVDENLLEKINELAVKRSIVGDNVLVAQISLRKQGVVKKLTSIFFIA